MNTLACSERTRRDHRKASLDDEANISIKPAINKDLGVPELDFLQR